MSIEEIRDSMKNMNNRTFQNSADVTHDAAHTPEWMIKCKDLFASNIEGVNDGVPCARPGFLVLNKADHHKLAYSGTSNGRVICTYPEIQLFREGLWVPMIVGAITSNKSTDLAIDLVQMTMRDKPTETQKVSFTGCKIISFDTTTLRMKFAFIKAIYSIVAFKQDGSVDGNIAAEIDFGKATSAAS